MYNIILLPPEKKNKKGNKYIIHVINKPPTLPAAAANYSRNYTKYRE